MTTIALFTCNGTIIGNVWIPELGLGTSEGVVRDAREVLCKTRYLVRVCVSKSDGCH